MCSAGHLRWRTKFCFTDKYPSFQ